MYTRRELQEIVLCLDYAKNYGHGTGGHNGYVLGEKLARGSQEKIVQALVVVFDLAIHHDAHGIVAAAIISSPEAFIPDEKRK